MIDLLDSHTHSLVSGHAYNSINEMIAQAREKGLKLIAVTEHGPSMLGSCGELYFRNLKIQPRTRDGLWTLFGAEVNIMDWTGKLDLMESTLKMLDVVIASIHPPTYTKIEDADEEVIAEKNTTAYIRTMQNPYVNIIGHPDDGRYPVHYDELVRAAKAYHVLLEVNNTSFLERNYRQNARENYLQMLLYCKQYEEPIIINSDAHLDLEVGEHTEAWNLIKEVDFPERLIVNTDLDLYFSYINYNPLFE